MSEFSIDLAAERINEPRSKSYFQEVLRGFISGNYRSSVVMLWSVVMADLIYKLKFLKDVHQDPVAISILEEIEKRQAANPTSSDWEAYLLDNVHDRTQLLEMPEYLHLVNLQKLRHLSAHPVISSGNVLFTPNKETARATIRNALESVLLKPAIFSKKIVSEFTEDLASKKNLLPDQTALGKYLEAKYFQNLHESVERELIRALWKFCFRISNSDADENRDINLRALHILYKRDPASFLSAIKADPHYFSSVGSSEKALNALTLFMSECPVLFAHLTDAAKVPLATFCDGKPRLLIQATFLSSSFTAHISKISALPYETIRSFEADSWKKFSADAKEMHCEQEVYRLGIDTFIRSGSFDAADASFAKFIKPYLAEFNPENITELLDGIESNSQIWGRGRASVDHKLVKSRIDELGGIDMTLYENFTESIS